MSEQSNVIWDNFWRRSGISGFAEELDQERKGIRFQRIMHRINAVIRKPISELRTVELGAGRGVYSTLMALLGAQVTLIDNSQEALSIADKCFAEQGLQGEFLPIDAANLPPDLLGKYDISMSFGLAEHFSGRLREQIVFSHFKMLRDGGLAFISVPNKWNAPYRLCKSVLTLAGKWTIGLEIPFGRSEFALLCSRYGIYDYGFLGESLFDSMKFLQTLNPIDYYRRHFTGKKKQSKASSYGTPFDQYLSYALVLWAVQHTNVEC